MRRWLNKHWLYIVAFGVGLMLTPMSIRAAYIQRGYFAIGGEYLIIPFMLLVTMLIDEIKAAINVFVVSTKGENISIDTADSGIKKDA